MALPNRSHELIEPSCLIWQDGQWWLKAQELLAPLEYIPVALAKWQKGRTNPVGHEVLLTAGGGGMLRRRLGKGPLRTVRWFPRGTFGILNGPIWQVSLIGRPGQVQIRHVRAENSYQALVLSGLRSEAPTDLIFISLVNAGGLVTTTKTKPR